MQRAPRPETEAAPAGLRVGERLLLFPDRPEPGLARRGHAARLSDGRGELLAMVAPPRGLTRLDIATQIKGLAEPALLPLQDWAIVPWPEGGPDRPVFFYDRPQGAPLFPPGSFDRRPAEMPAPTRPPMAEDQLLRTVLQPVAQLILNLSERGLVHGDIRPDTLFHTGHGNAPAQLGCCLSAPAGLDQPTLFLTVPRGLADPAGRGEGTPGDDLFALGVTLLVLLFGRSPLDGLSDMAQLMLRAERGTYTALTGRTRLPTSLQEPLRGFLADEPAQRWSMMDLSHWLAGRRLSPRQPTLSRKAARPLTFLGAEHVRPRTLAIAFARSPKDAAPVVEGGELDRWLRRSAVDLAAAERVAEAVTSAAANARGAPEERLVARICMALDPEAPMRYRGLALLPAGFGTALACCLLEERPPQLLAEMLAGQLPLFWYKMQAAPRSETLPMITRFDRVRTMLSSQIPGGGLERVAYELCPALPCCSPLVRTAHVTDLRGLLPALERAAGRGDRPPLPGDRHVAAFLSSRDRILGKSIQEALLDEGNAAGAARGLLRTYVRLQHGQKGPPLPALAGWFVTALEPWIANTRSRSEQAGVRDRLRAAAAEGSLANLWAIVDDPERDRRDRAGFARAVQEIRHLEREAARLRGRIEDATGRVMDEGRETAAMVSGALAAVAGGAAALVKLVGGP